MPKERVTVPAPTHYDTTHIGNVIEGGIKENRLYILFMNDLLY